MLNNFKSAFKNSVIYGIGNIATKIVGFILLPLYTHKLSVSEYGILSVLEITSQALVAIFGLALYQGFNRWYWDKRYINKQKSIFFTVLSTLILISILLSISVYIGAEKFSTLLFGNLDYYRPIRLMAIVAMFQIISILCLTLMKLQQKALLYSLVNLVRFASGFILTVYFIAFRNMKIEGIYLAQVCSYGLFFLLLIRYILRNCTFNFEVTILKEIIGYSIPLVLTSMAGIILTISDRYCLKILGALSYVGLYSLGFKLANFIKVFFISSVQLAINPIIYKMMDSPDNKRFYSKLMTYFCYGVMLFVIFTSIFGREIIVLLSHSNSDYWEAYKIVPIICFSILFGMMKDTAVIGLNITKNTRIIARSTVLIALLNIGLNIILISKYNFIGAAVATIISQIIYFLLIVTAAQKKYYIPFEFKKILIMIIAGCALVIISYLIININVSSRLVIKLLLFLSYQFILYFFNFYEPIELLRLKQSWHKWRQPRNWKKIFTNKRDKINH